MSAAEPSDPFPPSERELEGLLDRRRAAGEALASQAPTIAAACRDMAVRFHRGGQLIAFGAGSSAADAEHVTVEFLHPVIVGKRALPALCLSREAGGSPGASDADLFAGPLSRFARPADIAMAISPGTESESVGRALAGARARGLLTVSLAGGAVAVAAPEVDHRIVAASDDPLVVREMQVTAYHVLWELVHVFLGQSAVDAGMKRG